MEGTPLFELFQQEDSDAAYRFLENCTEEWLTQEQEEKQTKDVILHFVVKKFLPDANENEAIGPSRDQFLIAVATAFGVEKSQLRKHVYMKDLQNIKEDFKERSPALFSKLEEATAGSDDEAEA